MNNSSHLAQHNLAYTINHTPMHRYQWLIVALAVVLNMLDGFDVLAIAFTAKSIQNELGLTGTQIGSLMSAGFIGMAIGSMGLAPFADKFGRRPLLIIATALSALGMLMTYFASTVEGIALSRLITGVGVGGILPCTNVIVSEYANQKWRGLAIAIYASGFGIGAMLGGLSAVILQDEFGFRSVFMTGAVLTGLALVAIIALLPESVSFLNQQQPSNAANRLTKIANKIGKTGDWRLPPLSKQSKQTTAISQLFTSQQYKTTLLIWLAFIAVMSSFYFVSSWTPALLESSGLAKQQSQTVGMAISIGGAVGSLIFGFLVSHLSPRFTLMAFIALSSLAIIAFVFSPNLAIALAFAVLIGALINGCITGLYAINPTLYKPSFRSTGVGTAIGIGRLGSIASPILAGKLLDLGIGKDDLYLGASGVILLACVAVYFLHIPKQTD